MNEPLKVFTCRDAQGHYPVGFAAVVTAINIEDARRQLDIALTEDGLFNYDYTLQELSLDFPQAIILVNGDY